MYFRNALLKMLDLIELTGGGLRRMRFASAALLPLLLGVGGTPDECPLDLRSRDLAFDRSGTDGPAIGGVYHEPQPV